MLRSAAFALAFSVLWVPPALALEQGGRTTPPHVDGVLNHGAGNTVALTFDACPRSATGATYDPRIAAVLRQEKVPATFFISGLWALKHAAEVKDLASDPLFEIGNHGYRHIHPVHSTTAQNRRDMGMNQEVLRRMTGRTPTVWRPPYGEVDTAAVRVANSLGLQTIDFSLASGDPDKRISTKRLARAVVENAKPGGIIVFHANGNGIHTAEALPLIIAGLRKRGFHFVQAGSYVSSFRVARAKRR